MRRLIRLLRRERGASAVLFGLLLIPLLGFGGIAVDVGALYSEKAQLQNGADSVALTVAMACAKNEASAACTAGNPAGVAGANALDGVEDIQSVQVNTSTNVVTATTKSENLGIHHPLASMLPGVGQSSIVRAQGSATWGVPVKASTLALSIGYCEFLNAPPQDGVPNPTKITVMYNTGTRINCPGAFAPGGFGWLTSTNCSVLVDVTNPWVPSKTGNSTSGTGCSDAYIATLLGTTVLVPIYDNFRGTGSNTEFHIASFASFKLTGFKVSGSNSYVDPTAPKCNGSDRCLQGYFMKYVSVSDADILGDGSGLNLGTEIVRMTLNTAG